jgi:Rieske Fe-S protein
VDTTATYGDGTPRRAVLAAGSVGTAALLMGCAVYGRQPPPPPPPGGDTEGGGGDGESTPVVAAADVPLGGGVIAADLGVVVTQPSDGQFRGFSAICTHQGCTVASVEGGTINCPCHGSRFSIEDGSVVQAAQGLSPDQQSPLPEVGITVDGDTVSLP